MTLQRLRIQHVDPADKSAFADFYDVYASSQLHDRADTFTPEGAEAMRDGCLQAPDNVKNSLFTGYDGSVPVARGQLHIELTANRHLAALSVDVHPGHRRRGFGSATLARLEAEAKAAQRTAFFIETQLPPGAAPEVSGPYQFAARHGYRLAMREQRHQLDLPAEADLAALAAEAAGHHREYRIETFTGSVPENYLAGHAALMALIDAESPTGDIAFEPEDPAPELVRQRDAVRVSQGREAFGAVALGPDRQVVATTRMFETAGDASKITQGGTIVHHDHRGHRLGMAVKLANLRQLGSGYSCVTTWNALDNRPMIVINEALGFRVIEEGVTYQKLVPLRR